MAGTGVKIDRHCAYCLKFLPSGTWKLCGKCERRAYCSKECQASDWKPGRGSQGHKNWCGLKCCEEDLDWEIKEVPDKGLGVIAKRLIAAKARIMVEAVRDPDHPGINDLMPINGTCEEKIDMNAFRPNRCITLRMARLNHECDANAGHVHDETDDVMILFAERDIQPGEEITISYLTVKDTSHNDKLTPSVLRIALFVKWHIVCKSDCICYNTQLANLVQEGRKLDAEIAMIAEKEKPSDAEIKSAMEASRQLLKLQDEIKTSALCRIRATGQAFKIASMNIHTFEESLEYLRFAHEMQTAYCRPDPKRQSSNIQQVEALKEHIKTALLHEPGAMIHIRAIANAIVDLCFPECFSFLRD